MHMKSEELLLFYLLAALNCLFFWYIRLCHAGVTLALSLVRAAAVFCPWGHEWQPVPVASLTPRVRRQERV